MRKGGVTVERTTLLALATGLWLLACGGPLEYQVASSPSAPGADAHITADVKEKEKQTQLNVEIVNLPPPDRVDPAATLYMAWYRKDPTTVWSRIAVLTYEPESREATLVSAVPEVRFEMQITAEPASESASPAPTVVFKQLVAKAD
jgi:hypothetical protein